MIYVHEYRNRRISPTSIINAQVSSVLFCIFTHTASLCVPQVISAVLFQTAFIRVARGMLHNDQIGLAVHMSRIELKQSTSAANQYEQEFQHFLHSQV